MVFPGRPKEEGKSIVELFVGSMEAFDRMLESFTEIPKAFVGVVIKNYGTLDTSSNQPVEDFHLQEKIVASLELLMSFGYITSKLLRDIQDNCLFKMIEKIVILFKRY